MANIKKSINENVAGDLFVDETCINCDACRRFSPPNFAVHPEFSYVNKQPSNEQEYLDCAMALLSCPVGAIGFGPKSKHKNILLQARDQFPLQIDGDVYINGFNHRKTFGADSYFVKDNEGNWLIDSPRFTRKLVNKIEAMGGLSYIFLSHQDDIGDSEKFAKYFGAKRIIQIYDSQKVSDAEIILDQKRTEINSAVIVHTPGHTKGSQCLIWKGKYLFTGDHFAFIRRLGHFASFRKACWYDWTTQIKSIELLQDFKNVEWVLPGHGSRGQVQKGEFPDIIKKAVEWMHSVA
jgi:glyoxylase-like metal-dependent hydrolase (beta-lactamase superfamily II)/ferredoxin